MLTKKQWLKNTLDVFQKMKGDLKPYTIEILGKGLEVLPNVFSPKYFTDSEWFSLEIPKIVKEGSFLEIGTGTGVVALFVAINGSKEIVATDINPDAVENAKKNFTIHGFNISTREGDLYSPLQADERFDFIFWNHPFNNAPYKPKEILLRSGLDYQYEGLKRFIAEGRLHLNKGGQILLGTGNIARINEIKKIAKENNYSIRLLKKKVSPIEHGSDILMDVRIYSLKPL